jgi:Glycosyl hydrolases family 2, TIM barrel domain/Glycosyl hydrolases family 2, sugar binding domain/Glycosyl hydrolases family 2
VPLLPLLLVLLVAVPATARAAIPRAAELGRGWELRAEQAAPPATQQPAPLEGQPEGTAPPGESVAPEATRPAEVWRSTRVPGVFDPAANPDLYPGQVKVYRLRFRGPRTPHGWRWLLRFEGVRRVATVHLNGRRIGHDRDAYTPFELEARGLRPGKRNLLVVRVDNRKDPRLREGWWNWGGIVRPVRLVPAGPVTLRNLGWMSDVHCRGPARNCRATLLLDAAVENRLRRRVRPVVRVRLRAPGGRRFAKRFRLPMQRHGRRRSRLSMRVPAPHLWSPGNPQLYKGRVELRVDGRLMGVWRRAVGLRSVEVRRGLLYLNNRRIQVRGASIHEDMPGHGAALTGSDNARIVSDLKALGANVTRAHYLLNENLLRRLDRAGILVWNQAPVWQRDHGANLLRTRGRRQRALRTVRRTVLWGRSHPSVITHSVANELSFTPDSRPGTAPFLSRAQSIARSLDPTLPISVDVKGRPGFPEQFVYLKYDMLGINQYFGWYSWVADFNTLEPYLREMRDIYPDLALVMTEFGAEARPNQRDEPVDSMGSWAFQAFHLNRTLEVADRQPWLSGAIYWTLREFEIYPGWAGGPGYRRDPGAPPNTRHFKGLLTYAGEPKSAFYAARDKFLGVPLYAPPR